MDGKNSIIYSLAQPYSIKFIELYVNDVFTKTFHQTMMELRHKLHLV